MQIVQLQISQSISTVCTENMLIEFKASVFFFLLFQELSKITMPVVFNEPLTFLQRITEYLEYSTLLDLAAQQENPADRMMVIFV